MNNPVYTIVNVGNGYIVYCDDIEILPEGRYEYLTLEQAKALVRQCKEVDEES